MRTDHIWRSSSVSFRVRSESFVLYLSLPRRFHIRDLGLNRSAVGSDGGGLKKEAAQSARQRH
jgi:hypothetical protein